MRHVMLAGGLLVAMLTTSVVRAEFIKTITSGDFSLGYGFTSTGWNTTETASANTAPTGGFAVSVAPSSTAFSPSGISFPGRVPTTGGGYASFLKGSGLTAPIVANYTGLAPADVDPTNPDYQLRLEITNLGIYITDYWAGSSAGGNAQWQEITTGHVTQQDLTYVGTFSGTFTKVSDYAHLLWNPADYAVTLAGRNSSVTRSFAIPKIGDMDYRVIDGIEVWGRVVLSYNAVPEPSALALMAMGLVGLLCYAWRKRR